MKKTGICPKCDSSEVIYVNPTRMRNFNYIPTGLMTPGVPLERFVCYDCGYSEEWVASKEDRETLKQKYGLLQDKR